MDAKPFKKYFESIINRLEIGVQHQDYLRAHLLYLLLQFVLILKHNQCQQTLSLEFADIGYVLVSGQTAIAGKGDELLNNPDVGRLFLGG